MLRDKNRPAPLKGPAERDAPGISTGPHHADGSWLSVYSEARLTAGDGGVSSATQLGGEHSPPPLHKPLQSAYLSLGTHPYRHALLQRVAEAGGGEDEALWKVLIRTTEHTWPLCRLRFALLEHICVRDGGREAYELWGSKFFPLSHSLESHSCCL